MRYLRRHRWQLTVGTFLFLVGQVFATAHASEFGSESHEHFGVECVVALHDEQDALTPASSVTTLDFVSTGNAITQSIARPIGARLRVIRPPPTGPPSL